MNFVYIREYGVLGIVNRNYSEGSMLVTWFLDGIRTTEVFLPEEVIIVDKNFQGDVDD